MTKKIALLHFNVFLSAMEISNEEGEELDENIIEACKIVLKMANENISQELKKCTLRKLENKKLYREVKNDKRMD